MWPQEQRHGLRRLARNPLVTVTVVLTLAVGVGAVTTTFAVVRGALSPLGYPHPGALVRIYETLSSLKNSPNPSLAAIWNQVPVSYLNAADWLRESRTLSGIGLYKGYTAVLDARGEPLEISAAKIDSHLLGVLGVAPALGRTFSVLEVERREALVLLGHDLWASVFGADARILGRMLRLDGQQCMVVGVMPAGFKLAGRKDALWTPAGPTGEDLTMRDEHSYTAIGRLAPRATLTSARAELDRIATALAAAHPETNSRTGVRLVPLLDTVLSESRRVLVLLSAAAAAVLLIACVNLSSLLFAQAVERRAETALRFALGARRLHLLRQNAVEVLILAAGGSAGGLLIAALARRALPVLLAAELPRLEEISVDGRVIIFALATGLAATLASGLLPALFAPGAAPRRALVERRLVRLFRARGSLPAQFDLARGSLSALRALVVAEVALTLILTAGALTLTMSWLHLAAVEPGFDARGVLVQEIRLPAWLYPDEIRRGQFAARLLASLEALPGTDGAALTSRLPLPGPVQVWGFRLSGQDPPGGDWTHGRSATLQFATPGYFRLLRIPLLAGRIFDLRPGPASARVVMVSRALARRHWGDRSPLGAAVTMHGHDYRVVGVFGDLRHQGLTAEPGELMIQPWNQGPATAFAALVRVGSRPLDYAATVRRKLRELDPALPLAQAARLEDMVAQSLIGPRSRALLVGLSSGVALFLALIGVYGVMAYSIGRRRREIAIRMAVGADRRRVRLWLLRHILALALAGISLGALGALAARRLLTGLLYGVGAGDATGLMATALLLLSACLAAGYFPARKASRIDPASTLRSD